LYDDEVPRWIKGLIFGTTLFIHLAVAGLYSDSQNMDIGLAINTAIISLGVQKIFLLIFRLLIKK